MKHAFAILVITSLAAAASSALAQDTLEGDKRLACEAIMCLKSTTRPHECEPSLRRYFSIKARKPSTRMKKRADFLRLCPKAGETYADEVAAVNNSDPIDPDADMTPEEVREEIAALREEYQMVQEDLARAMADRTECIGRMGDAEDCTKEYNAVKQIQDRLDAIAARITQLQRRLAEHPFG